jgi:hypothetical protein
MKWQGITKQELQKLVSNNSGPAIAKIFGIHHNAVYEKCKVFGIAERWLHKNFDPSKEELEALYKTMTQVQLAKHYGVSVPTIKRSLRLFNTPIIPPGDRLRGVKKTLRHRLNMSRSAKASGIRAGSNNGNWKGGISKPAKLARSKAAYHEWKTAVFAASDWKCSKCGLEHGTVCKCCGTILYLHAHHIRSFADNEEARYDPENGIALCKSCHASEHHN